MAETQEEAQKNLAQRMDRMEEYFTILMKKMEGIAVTVQQSPQQQMPVIPPSTPIAAIASASKTKANVPPPIVVEEEENDVVFRDNPLYNNDPLKASTNLNVSIAGVGRPQSMPLSPEDKAYREKLDRLENVIKHVHGEDRFLDSEGMCFFPDAKLPEKFKWTSDKFDGTGNPSAHLKSFTGQMRAKGFTDEQVGQAFQFTLTGPALQWLMTLKPSQIRTWDDIRIAFKAQYSYNTELEITKRELETTRQMPSEGFTDYLIRFRKKAALMADRPDEQTQVDIMMKNLNSDYYGQMFALPIFTFAGLISVGQRIEDAIFHGTLPKGGTRNLMSTAPTPKRTYPGASTEVHTVTINPQQTSTLIISPSQPQKQQKQQPRQFTDLGMPMGLLMKKLISHGLLAKVRPINVATPLPRWYNPQHYCEYHTQQGHNTDDCPRLRHNIQDLLDQGKFSIQPKHQPDVVNNPLPVHEVAPSNVNSLEEDDGNQVLPPPIMLTEASPVPPDWTNAHL